MLEFGFHVLLEALVRAGSKFIPDRVADRVVSSRVPGHHRQNRLEHVDVVFAVCVVHLRHSSRFNGIRSAIRCTAVDARTGCPLARAPTLPCQPPIPFEGNPRLRQSPSTRRASNTRPLHTTRRSCRCLIPCPARGGQTIWQLFQIRPTRRSSSTVPSGFIVFPRPSGADPGSEWRIQFLNILLAPGKTLSMRRFVSFRGLRSCRPGEQPRIQRRKIQNRIERTMDSKMHVTTGKLNVNPSRTTRMSPGRRPNGILESHAQPIPASKNKIPTMIKYRCMNLRKEEGCRTNSIVIPLPRKNQTPKDASWWRRC